MAGQESGHPGAAPACGVPTGAAPVGAAMVIGSGVAGMQAALDLAASGIKVYLVESAPAIGGKMVQFDKTFPTNDCATCIISPKLVEVARNPNITLLTYSEVTAVEGTAGNFKVRVKRKSRFVDEERCTGCGICWNACVSRRIPLVKTIRKGSLVIGRSKDEGTSDGDLHP